MPPAVGLSSAHSEDLRELGCRTELFNLSDPEGIAELARRLGNIAIDVLICNAKKANVILYAD